MNNTVKINELIKYTISTKGEYKELLKIFTKNLKFRYLRHERKLVFDKFLNDYTGEYYYKVHLLFENEKSEIVAYVNTLDERLEYMDNVRITSEYILKITYHIIYEKLKRSEKITNYYINKLQRS